MVIGHLVAATIFLKGCTVTRTLSNQMIVDEKVVCNPTAAQSNINCLKNACTRTETLHGHARVSSVHPACRRVTPDTINACTC